MQEHNEFTENVARFYSVSDERSTFIAMELMPDWKQQSGLLIDSVARAEWVIAQCESWLKEKRCICGHDKSDVLALHDMGCEFNPYPSWLASEIR